MTASAPGSPLLHVDPESLLGVGSVEDLEPRLGAVVGGQHQQQTTVERLAHQGRRE
jgi:hypothetical protein